MSFAFLGGVISGLSSFLGGALSADALLAYLVISLGILSWWVLMTVSRIIYTAFSGQEHQSVLAIVFQDYIKEDGTFSWRHLGMVVLASLAAMGKYVCLLYAFQFAYAAEMNHGILASILGLSIFYNTLVGRLIFKEKLYLYHYLGIAGLLISVIMLGLESTIMGSDAQSESSMKPVLFAIGASIFLPLRLIIMKLAAN